MGPANLVIIHVRRDIEISQAYLPCSAVDVTLVNGQGRKAQGCSGLRICCTMIKLVILAMRYKNSRINKLLKR